MPLMPRAALLFLPLILVGCGWFGSEPTPELEDEFTYLFDGASLAHWQARGESAEFDVSRGAIRGRAPGVLLSESEFGNFVLRFEVRPTAWNVPVVLFRARAAVPGKPTGYVLTGDRLLRVSESGAAQTIGAANSRAVMAPGEWHTVEIEAIDAALRVSVNGQRIIDVVDGVQLSGGIGFSVPENPDGAMRWRHIRIKSLGARQWDAETLATARAWRTTGGASVSATGNTVVLTGDAGAALLSKRQFSDAILAFRLPVCDAPGQIDLRRSDDGSGVSLTITDSRALATLYTADGDSKLLGEGALVSKVSPVNVNLVMTGGRLAVNVGGVPVAQAAALPLAARGEFSIRPGACGQPAAIAEIAWIDLTRDSDAPQFYETLQTPPAPVLTAADELATFKLPPGFRAELVAAEPLVGDPVAMDWDEDGRLYVVEMRGFMQDAYGSGQHEPVGRVVVLEDTDRDGVMDRGNVFLDGLVLPRAVAVVNDGVLIGEPPNLWLCSRRDPLYCGSKTRVGDYAANFAESSVEHLENGLLKGIDNWLYNSKSNRRMRLDHGRLRVESTLPRGQWGIAMDDWGRLYHNHNSSWLMADFFPADDLLRDDIDLPEVSGLARVIADEQQVFSIRVNPGVNRAYLDGTLRKDGRLKEVTAVSGLTVMRGDAFPPPFAGDIFVPEPAANAVGQFHPTESGLAIAAAHITWPDAQWGQREFMASTDERFRPVDARVGPDGALYIIDMYRGIIQDADYLTDSLREQAFRRGLDVPVGLGRIWRITHASRELAAPPRLSSMRTRELIGLLDSDNGWLRDTAQRLLLAREDGLKALQLRAWAADGPGAVHALWVLAGRNALTAKDVVRVVARNHASVGEHAVRAGRALLDAEQLYALLNSEAGQAPRVQRELILALRDHGDQALTVGLLAGLARQWLAAEGGADAPYMLNAIVAAARGNELSLLEMLAELPGAPGAPAEALFGQLARHAYLTLRGDIRSDAPAPAQLTRLLDVAAALPVGLQVAALNGLAPLRLQEGFSPARLDGVPAIFADADLDADSPLWQARLSARRAFTWPGDELALGLQPLTPAQMALMQQGKAFYPLCAACHGNDGRGIAGLAPPLAESEWVTGPVEWLGRIILQGMTGPVAVNGQIWNGVMPAHAHHPGLDDGTLAGLMTYMRRAWGNAATAVTAEQVAAIRAASASRTTPWTAEALTEVRVDRGLDRYVGTYKVSFMKITVLEDAGELAMKVPMYGTSTLTPLDEPHAFATSNGDTSAVIRFVVEGDGRVQALRLKQGGNDVRAERVD